MDQVGSGFHDTRPVRKPYMLHLTWSNLIPHCHMNLRERSGRAGAEQLGSDLWFHPCCVCMLREKTHAGPARTAPTFKKAQPQNTLILGLDRATTSSFDTPNTCGECREAKGRPKVERLVEPNVGQKSWLVLWKRKLEFTLSFMGLFFFFLVKTFMGFFYLKMLLYLCAMERCNGHGSPWMVRPACKWGTSELMQ